MVKMGLAWYIDVVWKGISYAAQYKSMGYDDTTGTQVVNAIHMKDITLTFLRLSKPTALLAELIDNGYRWEQKFPGVYYVIGMADIKMQIVVGKELEGDEFVPLRVQRKNLAVENIEKFVRIIDETHEVRDRELVDTIFQLSIFENRELYAQIRKERPEMCEALRELMREDLDAARMSGYNDGYNDGLNAAGYNDGLNAGLNATARNMIGLGYDDAAIMAVTSLSMDAIANERRNM